MEYIDGENFKDLDDLYLLNRLRLNVDVRPLQWLKFSFQAQDSRVFGQNTLPAAALQKDAIDLGWATCKWEAMKGQLRFARAGSPWISAKATWLRTRTGPMSASHSTPHGSR